MDFTKTPRGLVPPGHVPRIFELFVPSFFHGLFVLDVFDLPLNEERVNGWDSKSDKQETSYKQVSIQDWVSMDPSSSGCDDLSPECRAAESRVELVRNLPVFECLLLKEYLHVGTISFAINDSGVICGKHFLDQTNWLWHCFV